MLSDEAFKAVISNTPLVALDFIVKNNKEEYFLGKRTNSPAKGFYFVPGGRILKSEPLQEAVQRISKRELGVSLKASSFKLKGIFDHLYEDSFFGPDVSTHYIVIALEAVIPLDAIHVDEMQHSSVLMLKKEEIVGRSDVHEYTKSYFIDLPSNEFRLKK